MPPGSPNTRSQELNILQELVRTAVGDAIRAGASGDAMAQERCRQELDALRTEVASQMGAFRGEAKANHDSVMRELSNGSVRFQDLDERVAELEGVNTRMQQSAQQEAQLREIRKAAGRSPDTTPLNNARSSTEAIERRRGKSDYLISPKIWNALILAMVAAAGGTLWHYIERAIWPREQVQSIQVVPDEAATVAPGASPHHQVVEPTPAPKQEHP